MGEVIAALFGIVLGVVVLGYAFMVYREIKSLPVGSDKMKEIAAAIEEGAMVFLNREYRIIGIFVLVVFILLGIFIDWRTAVAYIGGAVCSILAGFFGMKSATKANVRTAQAAATEGQGRALAVAFKGGNVMGLSVAGLGLLGLSIAFTLGIGLPDNPTDAVGIVAFVEKFAGIIGGFAMGASSVALFARIGGGIFTKGADVGADLVGKVEAGIPEDDPRNPATIADNVGDNVGDVAGMGADLFESYVGAVVATIVIAADFGRNEIALMSIPIILIALGSFSSIIGAKSVEWMKDLEPQLVLRRATFYAGGIYLAVSLIVLLAVGLVDDRTIDGILHFRISGKKDRGSFRDRCCNQYYRRAFGRNGEHNTSCNCDRNSHRPFIHIRGSIRHRHSRCQHAGYHRHHDVGRRLRARCRQCGRYH